MIISLAPEIEAVARALAYAEWPYASEQERKNWADVHWVDKVNMARTAIAALDQHRNSPSFPLGTG